MTKKASKKKASKKKATKKRVKRATVEKPFNKFGAQRPGPAPAHTPELVDYIMEELAGGRSLRSICSDDCVPVRESTVRWWIYKDTPDGIAKQYYIARDLGNDAMADEMKEIADDGQNDWMQRYGKDGDALGWSINGEHVQRSRLRVDTRKFLLVKQSPKKYGDRLNLEQTKNLEEATEEEILSEIARQIMAADSPDLIKQLEEVLNTAKG